MHTDCDAISDVNEIQWNQSRVSLKRGAGQWATRYTYAVKGGGNKEPRCQGKF